MAKSATQKSDDKRIAGLIQSRFDRMLSEQQPIFDDADTYYQMYKSSMAFDDAYPWDFQLVDPVIFHLIRSMMARLNPEGLRVDLQPTSSKSFVTKEKNQKIINWELREMNKTMVFYYALFGGLLRGRSYIETGWKYEPAVKIVTGTQENPVEKVMRDLVNRADAKNIRFEDIYIPNRNEPDINKQPYIIQRVAMRFGEMMDDNERGEVWNVDYMEKIKKGGYFSKKLPYGELLPDDGDEYKNLAKADEFLRSQYLVMLKMQTIDGEVYYKPEGKEDWIMNVNRTNPYWHGHYNIISWSPFPEDNEFFSMGMVQPVADIAIAMSSVLNQYLTNARKAGNPMWIAGDSASQTPDWQFSNRPDGIVRVAGDVNQVRQVTTADTSNASLGMRQHLSTTFEKATSMGSLYTSGVGDDGGINKTAGGAKIIDANMDLPLNLLMTIFTSQLLTKIGEHFLELNAQYITEDQEFKITGSHGVEFVKATPEEITANFEIYCNPETITKVSSQTKQASLMNLKATADKETKIIIDKRPIWKALVQSFPEIEGIDDIIIDPEEQADEAIQALNKGVMPEVNYMVDFEKVRQIVQVYMLGHQDEMEDNILQGYVAYVDELSKWIESKKQIIMMEQMQQMQGAMNAGMPGVGSNGAMPMNDADVQRSLEQRGVVDGQRLPVAMPGQ